MGRAQQSILLKHGNRTLQRSHSDFIDGCLGSVMRLDCAKWVQGGGNNAVERINRNIWHDSDGFCYYAGNCVVTC